MGFERRCQRKAGCPLLGFNRDAGQSLLSPASPSTPFLPKIRLESKQTWLILPSRETKGDGGGGIRRERKDTTVVTQACSVLSLNYRANSAFRIFPTLKLFVLKIGEKETFLVSVASHQVSRSQLEPEECSECRGLTFPKENKKSSSFTSGSLRWLFSFLFLPNVK